MAILMNQKKLSTKKILEVYQRLFINQCYLCHAKHIGSLCSFCEIGFSRNQFACQICQRTTQSHHNFICGQCQTSLPPYDVCLAPLRFEGITKNLIHAIKFHQQAHYIRPLIQLLYQALAEYYQSPNTWPTQLVFVPSHPMRIKERGFCQTQLMAFELHKTLLLHIDSNTPRFTQQSPITKIKNTQAQHTLSRKQRIENQKNIYQITGKIDTHVALFDDVMTSGNTLENCTKQLKESGAEQVDIWVIARTPEKNE